MIRPTAAQIRSWSEADFAAAGKAAATPDPLDPLIASAAFELKQWLCGRTLDQITDPDEIEVVNAILRMRVEMLTLLSTQSMVEESSTGVGPVVSFSVPGYSESRAQDRSTLKWEGSGPAPLTGWPLLDSMVGMLMSDECRLQWAERLGGGNTPAFAITEVDWRESEPVASPPYWPGWGYL